ncbi:hypothetical protein CYLTODRAFT_491554 [Cylindrobasidium torrendii FP15055 ss-10]|uniref:NYN domain-containing protein n=1 Tax=Cylindrobasidium torrendii FP15055 ss-10 TaxID=1314674 RepID=A0A0D7B756_9AGAR|nr:hypothetical protein CYLTODRAFT_491554 [Cylindrobasidium torrendii FP15055 ss-10]
MASSHKVGIFWDYVSCPAPDDALGDVVAEELRSIVGQSGKIEKFCVYLDAMDEADRVDFCHELQVSGVGLVATPRGRGQASMMLVDAILFARQSSPQTTTVVLIAADRTFAYAVAELKKLGYKIVVVAPDVPEARLLKAKASATVDWAKFKRGEPKVDLTPSPSVNPGLLWNPITAHYPADFADVNLESVASEDGSDEFSIVQRANVLGEGSNASHAQESSPRLHASVNPIAPAEGEVEGEGSQIAAMSKGQIKKARLKAKREEERERYKV